MDRNTRTWWSLLSAASVLNIGLYAWLAPQQDLDVQVVCCGIYVLVCAFRSFVPRVDLERTVLWDHPLSSIVLGRSCATVAEMAFTVQLADLLAQLAVYTGTLWLDPVGDGLVWTIAVAQCACWLGVLTLDHRWHAVEELLWGGAMLPLGACFLAAWSGAGPYRPLLVVGLLGCAFSAYVMLLSDVPMYWRRHAEEREKGTRTLGIGEGLRDALTRRHLRQDWDTWRHETLWMTPYFTAAVWGSIGMMVLEFGG